MDLYRQQDLIEPDQLDVPVTVVGCGGIGSFVVLALAKMGCRALAAYDDDRVEPHNIPNQAYRLSDVGRLKVEALADFVRDVAGAPLKIRAERVREQRLQGVVVTAVDTMADRREIWLRGIRYRAGVPLYLDARMGAEVARILTVRPADPDDVRRYEASLYADEEAVLLPCTAQAIVYTGFSIAGLVAGQIKKFLTGEPLKGELILDHKTLTFVAC
ncbi:MAG: ThiF family adenylyltransferase [Candidatus Methylomirabilales bacterium]